LKPSWGELVDVPFKSLGEVDVVFADVGDGGGAFAEFGVSVGL